MKLGFRVGVVSVFAIAHNPAQLAELRGVVLGEILSRKPISRADALLANSLF
jgi:hypothetical protein